MAAIDSALHRHRITNAELATALSGSARSSRCLALSDHRAESGTESIARVRFAAAGIESEVQVWVTPKYRVDLLIDGWLVVEIDGREFHGNADASSRDYRRDADLIRLGHSVLHFDYTQVVFDWDATLATTLVTLMGGRAAIGLR